MFFLRKHKQKKDQGAGLVFRWRGARRHHAGKILALLLSLGFFAFSAYAIRVEGLRTPLLTKQTGKVVMLSAEDPHCRRLLEQVEDRSPFPFRWDPALDAMTMGRISDATDLLGGRVWDYQPLMVQLPEAEGLMGLPSIFEENSRFFDSCVNEWDDASGGGQHFSTKRPNGDLRVIAQFVADQEMRDRLPTGELPLPNDLIVDEWFGHSFRFLLGVDSLGVVRGCLPLSSESMEVVKPTEKQKFLAAWLRKTGFKPSDQVGGGVSIGVLELKIEAIEE